MNDNPKKHNWLNIAIAIVFPVVIGINIVGVYFSYNSVQQAKVNTMQIEQQINCIAGYFNIQNRNGNTVLNCEIK